MARDERPLLDLIDGRADVQPIIQVDYDRSESNFQRFAKFHDANPHVYRLIVKTCRYAKGHGVSHFGIGAIFERLRWFYLETRGDEYRLNNSFRAYYARLVMAQEPDLMNFFETRVSQGDANFGRQEEASA